jgi:hypothetical protein
VIDVAAEFGRRLNIPVAKKLALDDDFIVLLDYYEASKTHQHGNLFRISADGALVWTISLAGNDMVTNVEWRTGSLIAWTWGCSMITIDKSNGTVLDSVFTK